MAMSRFNPLFFLSDQSARRAIRILSVLLFVAFTFGCEDSDSGSYPFASHDFGDNDPDRYVSLGDSITSGAPGSTVVQYPAKLSAILGKRVINAGIGGEQSSGGAARVRSVLNAHKPGFLLILYGANDVHDYDADFTINNLTTMIVAAKSNGTIPVLATITPAFEHYGFISADAPELNSRIKQLAEEHGLVVADLAAAFGQKQELFLSDNLHPNEAGTDLIATTFADVLR